MKRKSIVGTSLFTLILAFIAIGTFAFTKEVEKKENPVKERKLVEKKVLTQIWYFKGGPSDSRTNPNNYTDDPNEAPPCELPLQTICQIEAPDDGTGRPNMEAPVMGEDEEVTVALQIEEAYQSLSGTATPNATVKEFRAH